MKVKELIEVLSKHDPEAMAVVRGYEGGVNEVNHASACQVKLNVNSDWYYGKHEVFDEEWDDDPKYVDGLKMAPAVRIHV